MPNLQRLLYHDCSYREAIMKRPSCYYLLRGKGFLINFDGHSFKGKLGELIERNGISLKIDDINAPHGTEFIIKYVSRLKAISELQDKLTVNDQGKDTGILNISLTGDNPVLIEKLLIVSLTTI